MGLFQGDGAIRRSQSYVFNSTTLEWEAMLQPGAAAPASSAGFHFDGAVALNIAGSFSASTTVNVSSLAGKVTVDQNSTVWAVQIPTSQSIQVKNSTIGDLLASVQQNSTVWQVQVGGYSTIVSIAAVAAGAGKLNIGSTAADNAVLTTPVSTGFVKLAGFFVDTSNALSVKLDGSTALTIGSIAVGAGRINIGSTATENVVISRSSAADQLVTVYQSSYAALLANVHNSTIGDLLASVQQNSTVWQTQAKIQDSSGVSPNIVGTRPSTGAQGFAVRPVLNDLQSTCFSTLGNNSTSSTLASSVAAQRVKVYAYSITSTVQAINTISFASSLATPIWQVQMQAMSSGITGVNLAVSPPAWLFATAASEALVWKCTGSTGTYHVSVAWFTEA